MFRRVRRVKTLRLEFGDFFSSVYTVGQKYRKEYEYTLNYPNQDPQLLPCTRTTEAASIVNTLPEISTCTFPTSGEEVNLRTTASTNSSRLIAGNNLTLDRA